jgi:hypothetical protein
MGFGSSCLGATGAVRVAPKKLEAAIVRSTSFMATSMNVRRAKEVR